MDLNEVKELITFCKELNIVEFKYDKLHVIFASPKSILQEVLQELPKASTAEEIEIAKRRAYDDLVFMSST